MARMSRKQAVSLVWRLTADTRVYALSSIASGWVVVAVVSWLLLFVRLYWAKSASCFLYSE